MTLHTRRESHAYPTSAELGLVVGATQRRPAPAASHALMLLARCRTDQCVGNARHTPAKRSNGGGAKFGARGAGIRTLVHTHASDPRERVRIGSWFMNTLTPEPAPSRRGSIPRPATLGLVAFPRENQCSVQTTD